MIYPTDLDGIFQSTIAAYSHETRLAVSVLIPTKLKSLWISNELLDRHPGKHLEVLAKTTFRDFRKADFSIRAVDAQNRKLVVVNGFRQTAVNKQSISSARESKPRHICYSVEWKPDLDLLPDDAIADLCENAIDPDTIPFMDLVDRQELVCLYYMKIALKEVSETRIKAMPEHLQKYMQWIQYCFDSKELEFLRSVHAENEKLFGDEKQREAFLFKFARDCAEDKLIVETSKNLLPVLNGKRDAFHLLFTDDLISGFYSNVSFVPSWKRLIIYIDLLAHKNPALDILEVETGTAATTTPIMCCLTCYTDRSDEEDDISRFQHYIFTDISPAFFEEAK